MNKTFFLTLLVAFSYACTSKSYEPEDVIGSWKYDTAAILSSVDPANVEENKMQLLQRTMSLYKDAIFLFEENGTLSIETNGIHLWGKWRLSLDGSQLIFNLSGKDMVNDITELASTRMILAPIPERGIFYPRIFVPAPNAEPGGK